MYYSNEKKVMLNQRSDDIKIPGHGFLLKIYDHDVAFPAFQEIWPILLQEFTTYLSMT